MNTSLLIVLTGEIWICSSYSFRHNGLHVMNIRKSNVVGSHLDGIETSYKAPLSGKLSVQRSAVFALLAEVKKDGKYWDLE